MAPETPEAEAEVEETKPPRKKRKLKSRFGVDLSRQTMSDWMYRLAQMLAMIYEAIRDEISAENYLQIDETPVHYQNPGNGTCSQGYLWAYHAPKKAARHLKQG